MNKISKHISGLTNNSETEANEGYIAEIQKKTADKLDEFISELKQQF